MSSSGSKEGITLYSGRQIKNKRNEDYDYSYFESKHPRLLKSSIISKNQNDGNDDSTIIPKDNTVNINNKVSANNYSDPSSSINQTINQTNLTNFKIGNNSRETNLNLNDTDLNTINIFINDSNTLLHDDKNIKTTKFPNIQRNKKALKKLASRKSNRNTSKKWNVRCKKRNYKADGNTNEEEKADLESTTHQLKSTFGRIISKADGNTNEEEKADLESTIHQLKSTFSRIISKADGNTNEEEKADLESIIHQLESTFGRIISKADGNTNEEEKADLESTTHQLKSKFGRIIKPKQYPDFVSDKIKRKYSRSKKIKLNNKNDENAIKENENENDESNLKKEDESDDDLIIVKVFQQPTIRKFFPVDYTWQLKMCNILNLNITEQLNSIESKPLNVPTVFRDVIGDGNCLFRSLSYCITGSEDNHYKIRKHILNTILTNPNILNYLGGINAITVYIKLIQSTTRVWGTDVDIYAAAILLKTSIYVFCTVTKEWNVFSKNGSLLSSPEENDKCIYLTNINNFHYKVVLNVQ